MFSRVASRQVSFLKSASKCFSNSSTRNTKVAVLGASGGIGQPLSLLLKQSEIISELVLYDVVNTAGVAADLSHIETNAKVSSKREYCHKSGHFIKDIQVPVVVIQS